MGALINFFKGLLSGILGFFGGNKSGFYMEAPELSAVETGAPQAVVAQAIVTETSPAQTKKERKEKDAKGKTMAATKAVQAPAALPSPEELMLAALKASAISPSTEGAPAPATAGFATQYNVPTLTSNRRRPGPSLKPFTSMAKEIRG